MSWVAIIAAFLQILLPFILDKWFKRRAERVQSRMPAPSTFATPEAAVDAFFKEMLAETPEPMRRLQVRWAWRLARRNASHFVNGTMGQVSLTAEEIDEGSQFVKRMGDAKQDAIDKLQLFVAENYGGSYEAAFRSYDKDGDSKISSVELASLLYDAEIGSRLTRGIYVRQVIDHVDSDGDGKVSWAEFEAQLT